MFLLNSSTVVQAIRHQVRFGVDQYGVIGATIINTSGLEKLVIIPVVMSTERTPRVEVSVFEVGRTRYSNHQDLPMHSTFSSVRRTPFRPRTCGGLSQQVQRDDYLRARINSEAASLVRAPVVSLIGGRLKPADPRATPPPPSNC